MTAILHGAASFQNLNEQKYLYLCAMNKPSSILTIADVIIYSGPVYTYIRVVYITEQECSSVWYKAKISRGYV